MFSTYNLTRMHSSRMRTVRCSGRLPGGGMCLPSGVPAKQVPAWGNICPGGFPGGRKCVSQHALRQCIKCIPSPAHSQLCGRTTDLRSL